jgi:hypothetical protein
VKNRFQTLPFKFNLQRYNAVVWKPHPAAILTGMSLARVFDDVLAHHGGAAQLLNSVYPWRLKAAGFNP